LEARRRASNSVDSLWVGVNSSGKHLDLL
jgi:hypothetical protein